MAAKVMKNIEIMLRNGCFLLQFDENQGFLGFFDECQELGMFAHTIYKNAWLVLIFAVPLQRQSDRKG